MLLRRVNNLDKLKEIWGKYKILIVLGLILIICLIAIIVVTVSYFFGGSESVYGDRLEGIENYLDRHGCKSIKEIIGALEI